ncbi:hypothetical protein POTOM_042880 [Populus tomentosa]|uniref:Uncharacterized protein n=1 Tax=Populus tomentosa TaxID=118781 RepID=A0A8X8C8J9_POPTO|nr:hypothetical protein POTOM_042880 [Populus tomentosa]
MLYSYEQVQMAQPRGKLLNLLIGFSLLQSWRSMGKAAWEELIDPVEQTGIVRFSHHQYSLSGIGGVETGGDAAEFILPGANTVQVDFTSYYYSLLEEKIKTVCTGVMMHGYGLVKKLREELKDFMKTHNFSSVEDFRGFHHSLPFLQEDAAQASASLAVDQTLEGIKDRIKIAYAETPTGT